MYPCDVGFLNVDAARRPSPARELLMVEVQLLRGDALGVVRCSRSG